MAKDNNKNTKNTVTSAYELMQVDEDSYLTTYSRKYLARNKYKPNNPKLATAFIPGTIQKVFVKPEMVVKKGDKLLVLEAMKMKNVLLAGADGVIKSVNVEVGSVVPKNFVLVEIE